MQNKWILTSDDIVKVCLYYTSLNNIAYNEMYEKGKTDLECQACSLGHLEMQFGSGDTKLGNAYALSEDKKESAEILEKEMNKFMEDEDVEFLKELLPDKVLSRIRCMNDGRLTRQQIAAAWNLMLSKLGYDVPKYMTIPENL